MMDEQEYLYRKNRFLTEFILLYKSHPCLWRTKSKEYHNREMRTSAYKELVQKLKETDGTADRQSVVKKINSLRSNLRKEQRKVQDLAKDGIAYIPKLWYFKLFSFLEGQTRNKDGNDSEDDTTDTSARNVKLEEIENDSEDFDEEEDDDPLQPCDKTQDINASEQEGSPSPKRHKKGFVQPVAQSEFAQTSKIFTFEVKPTPAPNLPDSGPSTVPSLPSGPNTAPSLPNIGSFTVSEDPHEIFGKHVASKLRNITLKNNTQSVLAEKIINDALFLAEMGQLTRSHCSKLNLD